MAYVCNRCWKWRKQNAELICTCSHLSRRLWFDGEPPIPFTRCVRADEGGSRGGWLSSSSYFHKHIHRSLFYKRNDEVADEKEKSRRPTISIPCRFQVLYRKIIDGFKNLETISEGLVLKCDFLSLDCCFLVG